MELSDLKRRVGERVAEVRESLGMSQAAFAKKLGLTQKAVSFVERGKNLPGLETLLRIMEAFDVGASILLDLHEARKPEKQAALDEIAAYLGSRSLPEIRRALTLCRAAFEPLQPKPRRGRPRARP